MKLLVSVKNFLLSLLDSRLGPALRKRYSVYTQTVSVKCPYVFKIDDHKELSGKVAVIIGGSGTIGRACAIKLASEGAKVYVCGTNLTSASIVVDEILSYGFEAVATKINVLDYISIESTFRHIADSNNGHLDILINSAGGSAREKAKEIIRQDVDVIDSVLNINLRGMILCSQVASKYMVDNAYGRIVNITSVIGLQGKAGFSEYAASKGGAIAFIKSLAQELGKNGITVNGVAPGIVQRGVISEEEMDRIRRTNWMNSYGKPEDIAAVVSFLCKQEAAFITGQNIAVDGGRSLGLKEI